MPIKFPKGFQRRKSSGNALEEVRNPPEPSFKVFERPTFGNKSFDGGNALRKLNNGQGASNTDHALEYDDELFPAGKQSNRYATSFEPLNFC